MHITPALILLASFQTYLCQDFKELFEEINTNVGNFNAVAADIAWESLVDPGNPNLLRKSALYQKERLIWQHETCDKLATLERRQLLNSTQSRQTYLLCRGPKYTFDEARITSKLYEELQKIYMEAEICINIPMEDNISTNNLTSIEGAILKYIKTAKDFLKNEHLQSEPILFSAQLAVKEKINVFNVLCLKGEDDFQNLMAFSRNEEVLRFLWLAWREKVGPPMKRPYKDLADVENRAARRNGYPDIGASWRDELEIPQLRQLCRRLYDKFQPLYALLHGVVRFYLRRQYGDVVPRTGPIPAHLLGNLWSQNWEPLADLILPKSIDLDQKIKKLNWTVQYMAKRAEDFYQSLGLPPMTDTFWRKSVFTRNDKDTRCHGTAADMFRDGDFRLLYCSGKTKEDFYVLHHEFGHIHYYMAYKHQPALFRQANTAFHEAIGDTIMYGVMTPQHLYRLGLINDSLLYTKNEISQSETSQTSKTLNKPIADGSNNNYYTKHFNEIENEEHNYDAENKYIESGLDITTDDILMLKQALNKIPQIPFALLIDEYRWKYFEGDFSSMNLNKAFWEMTLELQGIAPPVERGEEYFDIGAKFHVPDNTPYIRYFLSSFLQHQLFEKLCKAAVFGRRNAEEPIPDTISMHRCDIYGSKSAGKLLKDFMSRGHSQHYQQILLETLGQPDVSAEPLERYYRPLYNLLIKLVRLHRIPIGW